jgi:2-oxoglutarate/2-oxoacid ferredoxin oxidoreductase subunit beta
MPKKEIKLNTEAKNTWCPGCGNFGIMAALKNSLSSLIEGGIKKENIVLVSGIGCGSKIIDYLNLNTFSALHGRPIASAEGIKLGNPELTVIVSAGDGGAYDEGISHLIHAAKRNIDITVLVHDNRLFALTTGQFTATSPKGFKGRSTPEGSIEEPFDPLEMMIASGATFVARGYVLKNNHLQKIIGEAVEHKGFSFVDILQPCVTFFNATDFYNERVYEMNSVPGSKKEALDKINEWNYQNHNEGGKIPIGVFYKQQKPTYEQKLLLGLNPSRGKKKPSFKKILEE